MKEGLINKYMFDNIISRLDTLDMGIFSSNSNASGAFSSALGLQTEGTKGEKFASMIMHLFMYGIIFLGGFIFAKIQTLLSGI